MVEGVKFKRLVSRRDREKFVEIELKRVIDDGAPWYDDDELGDIASDVTSELCERRSACIELLYRIESMMEEG